AQFDKDIIEVRFIKGWNKILIKTAENWGSWGFYFRITDLNGNTPGDVTFDPLKDDARVKKIYARLKRQKGIKIARTTLFYGFTLLILSSGIYLLISNIYNKIKIRQMKEDFISSVSHELKTPLAAIKMFTETLNMGRVKSEKQIKEYYATIIRETDRLTRFINKILDFQKIEKGKKIYSFENVSIKNLLASAIDIYKDQVQDEGLVVEEECPSDLPEIEVDEDAMLQVLLNLLTNAYKYSKVEKYIKVKARAEGNFIFISVIDRGMGISKDRITKIFDKFYRVDRDSAKDIKGSGIGLAFVKSVVEAHNGEIAVESQLNKGSTFTISLPIKREG
ncbi:MAG: HAMP domain-containing histidine kinase, partial [Candidatus Omnitrophica bacterium]|nr:HAMP domain-containing histidine kinase [Candidatus Omnitrophota bacterium]